jgi:hypothetical protein
MIINKYQLQISDPASGTSVDWAKASARIKYTYLVELRPAKGNDAQHTGTIMLNTEFTGLKNSLICISARTGFILQKRELIPCAIETWAGVKVVIEAVLKLHNLQRKSELTENSKQNGTITTSAVPGITTTADPFLKRIHLHN